MEIKWNDFKRKDVIDLCSGKKLGKVRDMLFTFPDGKIKNVSAGGLFCGDDGVVPFSCIVRIGDDAILIDKRKNDKRCPPNVRPNENGCIPPCTPRFFDENKKGRLDEEDYE